VAGAVIIGHLPAGYITSQLLHARFASAGTSRAAFVLWGLVGSVAPDFDMLYFHYVDHRRHGHHSYWSHFPIVWCALLLVAIVWWQLARRPTRAPSAIVFALGGLVHMLLDTTVGGIRWLAPFDRHSFRFFQLPSLYDPWWLNFILHWTFALELALVAGAVALWRRSR
jgi:membrane-bound metal-dependent hydrolase YbcI (DUF457 family)